MLHLLSRYVLLASLTAVVTACGVPSSSDEDASDPVASASSALEVPDQPADAPGLSVESETATCPLTLVEPCIAAYAVCSVRCCDGTLYSTFQWCGQCGEWSKNACASNGTRARIRWSCPCWNP